jgi:hypothetical protein
VNGDHELHLLELGFKRRLMSLQLSHPLFIFVELFLFVRIFVDKRENLLKLRLFYVIQSDCGHKLRYRIDVPRI